MRGRVIEDGFLGQAPTSDTITQFFPPCNPPDPVNYLSDVQTYDPKTRVDIWKRMYVVPVEYETFVHTFYLKMWFFQVITGITFKWDYVLWRIITRLVWIGG